jgi:hypothetical protein
MASELLQGTRSPIVLLAAAKARQSTWEGPLWGGGVFTYALSEVIQTNRNLYDLDCDGVLSVSELFRGLRAAIRIATGGNQQPWLARHDMIGDFPVI